MVVSYSLESAEKEGMEQLKYVTDKAIKNGYTVIGLSASGEEEKQRVKERYQLDFNWYLCDEKALKTIVRSNPGILELQKGTVIQKVHWNDVDELILLEVERKPRSFEEKNKESILYLIDGEVSSKETVDDLDENYIENLLFTVDESVLDSLNKKLNGNYNGFMNVTLKKE